jgi:hypothetical protein
LPLQSPQWADRMPGVVFQIPQRRAVVREAVERMICRSRSDGLQRATNFCYESDPEHNSAVMLSGHGRPSRAGSGTSIALTNETAELLKPYHLPGQVLLNDLNDRDYYVKVVGRESVQGVNAIHLRVVRYLAQYVEKDSTQDWWLDSSTNLPIKVTYLTPGQQIEAYMPTTLIYSSWSAESGRLLVPHQQSTLLESTILLRTCTLSKLEFNSHPASTLFDAR